MFTSKYMYTPQGFPAVYCSVLTSSVIIMAARSGLLPPCVILVLVLRHMKLLFPTHFLKVLCHQYRQFILSLWGRMLVDSLQCLDTLPPTDLGYCFIRNVLWVAISSKVMPQSMKRDSLASGFLSDRLKSGSDLLRRVRNNRFVLRSYLIFQ